MFASIRSITTANRLILLAFIMVMLPLSVPAQPDPARQQPSPEPAKPEPSRRSEQPAAEDENRPRDPMSTPTFNGLRFRSIGPAFTSGRVIGFAVDPNNSAHYFVASASGGVWKTVNNGPTWTPVFDRRDRAGPEKSFDRVGGFRREQQPTQCFVRQWSLSFR